MSRVILVCSTSELSVHCAANSLQSIPCSSSVTKLEVEIGIFEYHFVSTCHHNAFFETSVRYAAGNCISESTSWRKTCPSIVTVYVCMKLIYVHPYIYIYIYIYTIAHVCRLHVQIYVQVLLHWKFFENYACTCTLCSWGDMIKNALIVFFFFLTFQKIFHALPWKLYTRTWTTHKMIMIMLMIIPYVCKESGRAIHSDCRCTCWRSVIAVVVTVYFHVVFGRHARFWQNCTSYNFFLLPQCLFSQTCSFSCCSTFLTS